MYINKWVNERSHILPLINSVLSWCCLIHSPGRSAVLKTYFIFPHKFVHKCKYIKYCNENHGFPHMLTCSTSIGTFDLGSQSKMVGNKIKMHKLCHHNTLVTTTECPLLPKCCLSSKLLSCFPSASFLSGPSGSLTTHLELKLLLLYSLMHTL